MRGKYITTSLRLAALSGGKKMKTIGMKLTSAVITNYQPDFKKMTYSKSFEDTRVKTYLAEAV